MTLVEQLRAMARQHRARETGRILGKLEANPSSVTLDELGRVDMEFVDETRPPLIELLRARFCRQPA